MENQSSSLSQAIAAILRFPPVMRKIQREFYARAQRKADTAIAHHHVMILKMLQESGTMSSSELGAMVFISNAQMTHSTEKLMAVGLIEKQQDLVDRRKVNIRLTPKGQEAIQRFDEFMLDLIQENLTGLSDADLEKLAESFDNIVEVYSR